MSSGVMFFVRCFMLLIVEKDGFSYAEDENAQLASPQQGTDERQLKDEVCSCYMLSDCQKRNMLNLCC